MDALGYKLVMAKQNKTKDADKNKYGTHIVGFQHDDLYISGKDGQMEARPTIVMINNHFGTFPYDCQTGIYRLVCENRLMVKEKALDGFRNRHTKYNLQEVKDLVDSKVGGMVQVTECITNWSMREMTPMERYTFAEEALTLRTTVDRRPTIDELDEILTPRRSADKGNDLYRTFNVVQENLIKGGYEFNERKVRAITNPLLDVQLNQQLWGMASAYAKH
jgi:hypothetical protein